MTPGRHPSPEPEQPLLPGLRLASSGVSSASSRASSLLRVPKNDSATALSQLSPRRLMLQTIPLALNAAW